MHTAMRAFEGGAGEWDTLIRGLPNPHLLQTWEWAHVKSVNGWQPIPLVWTESASANVLAAAMILKKPVLRSAFAARLSILYVPKGPLLDWSDKPLRTQVLEDLRVLARAERAIFVKVDPDIVLGRGIPGEAQATDSVDGRAVVDELRQTGWLLSADQIQFRNSVWLHLTASEDAILQRMAQKTRYNIRLSERRGVTIRRARADELSGLYKMYAETSTRDGFVIRGEGYYRQVWSTFLDRGAGRSEPAAHALIAEVEDEPVAALFLFHFAGRAYYLYGMSREAHREKMPNYLLQWEAMRVARELGCTLYDLWGAPDRFDAEDPLWGVFRFKQGFGGEVVRTLGAWDYPGSFFWYRMYTGIVPRALDIMRRRGREETRRDLAAA